MAMNKNKAKEFINARGIELTDDQLDNVVGGAIDTTAIIDDLREIGGGCPDIEEVIGLFLSGNTLDALIKAADIGVKDPVLYDQCEKCIVKHLFSSGSSEQ